MLYDAMMKETINWIFNNLEGKMDVRDVAVRVGYSRGHIQRVFKLHSGKTLASFIRYQKLRHALIEIIISEQRILDIALKFGFESNANFTRAFRRIFGCSPNLIRKRNYRALLLACIN